MRRTRAQVTLVILLAAIQWAGCGGMEETHSYSWWKIAFDLPLQCRGPIELGIGAVAFVYPADSEPGQAKVEITLIAVPADLQNSLDNDQDAILDFVKGTFLGTTSRADENIERTFLGNNIVGDVQNITIPRRGQMETYLIPLSDGDMVAVSVMHAAETAADHSTRVVEALAATLKEVPLK
ncbi:MAG: hypothetical protein M5R41_09115 [Bacteroidia bacterium]|nr:hypothetical protein [Bacteroidia bacterium]